MRTATISLLTILCLALSAPAFAQKYNNDPTNGTNDAYFVGIYSDPFVPIANTNIPGSSFAGYTPPYVNASVIGGMSVTSSEVPTGETGTLWAYSETKIGNNATVTVTGPSGIPIKCLPRVCDSNDAFSFFRTSLPAIPTGAGKFTQKWGPFGKPQSLPIIFESDTSDASGHAQGIAAEFAAGVNTTRLWVNANVSTSLVAFARAEDPLSFGPGQNLLTSTISGIVLHSSGGAGTGFEADESSTLPGLSDLFTLKIIALGDIKSPADLFISFVSDPLLGLNDSEIVKELRADFSVSGDTATLEDPLALSFTLDATQSYDLSYAAAAEAEAGTTPEPPSMLLLGSGVLALAGFLRKRLVNG